MKKKNKKKPTITDYVNTIIMIILLACFVIIGKQNYQKTEDNKVIEPIQSTILDKDNVFLKSSANDVYKQILSGDALVFFGLSNSKNSDYYAKAIDEVAKELDIKEVLYYDVLTDRKNSNGTYGLILEYLNHYLEKDDEGNVILHTPSFLIVKNNEIIYFDSLERIKADVTEDEYWDEYNYNLKKAYIEAGLKNYLGMVDQVEQ